MSSAAKLISLNRLLKLRKQFQLEGKSVVFTNGCFDLLHVGHVRYLQQAKTLGDILIVGLNSDSSIKRVKGPERPLMSQEDRAEILSALSCVDYVIIFDELTPEKLIFKLKPDIHCKGGDYANGKPIPEARVVKSYGGRVEILSYYPGHSTTDLIEKILRIYRGSK